MGLPENGECHPNGRFDRKNDDGPVDFTGVSLM
jgi:hypothetical protein